MSPSEFIKWLAVFGVQSSATGGGGPFLPLAGGTMTGDLILNEAPTVNLQAATKGYVDLSVAGLAPAGPVNAATTANFDATYDNGSAGVGATLTATSVGAVSFDGVTTILNGDYLIKNQTDATQNGIYVLTTVGDRTTQAVFTRSDRYDTPDDINNTGIVPVIAGDSQANSGWYETTTITTIGTDNLTFVKYGTEGTVTSVATGAGLTGGTITTSGTISLATIADDTLLANISGGVAAPSAVTLSSLIDSSITNVQNSMLYRGASAWTSVASANNAILTTSATGVPVFGNTVGADLTINTIPFGRGNGGADSIAIGSFAQDSTATGTGNIAIGVSALSSNTSNTPNLTVIGNSSVDITTAPGANTLAIGRLVMRASTGANNVAVGNYALRDGTVAFNNVCIGLSAMTAGTTGSNNVIVGFTAAAASNPSGCVVIGAAAGNTSTNTMADSVAVGNAAGRDADLFQSVLIGRNAGTRVTGQNNLMIGFRSGDAIITGTDNTLLGTNTGVSGSACQGAIAFGSSAIAQAATGATSSDASAGISFGSSTFPVGVRGDGSLYSGGASAGYWRPYINSGHYFVPLLQDGVITNSGVFVTNSSGVPSISTTIPAGVAQTGVTSGSNASAGTVGEFVSATGSPTAIASGVDQNACSISLSAGDWDLYGNISMAYSGGATPTGIRGAITATSATVPTGGLADGGAYALNETLTSDSYQTFVVGRTRVNITSTTTYYLAGATDFASGSATISGYLAARRVR